MIEKEAVLEIIDEYICENYEDLHPDTRTTLSDIRKMIGDIEERA